MLADEVKIRPKYKNLIPALAREERQQLHDNIVENGVMDRVKVWDGVVVDGHNRVEIAAELEIEFDVEELHFDSEAEAVEWIIKNQLGRRNLSPEKAKYLRGKLYNERKSEKPKKNPKGQFDPSVDTAAEVAAETGVSKPTVKRNGKYAEAKDKVATKVKQAIDRGDIKPTTTDLNRLAEYDAASQSDLVERVTIGDEPSVKAALDAEEVEDAVRDVETLAGPYKQSVTHLNWILREMASLAGSESHGNQQLSHSWERIKRDLTLAKGAISQATPVELTDKGEIVTKLRRDSRDK